MSLGPRATSGAAPRDLHELALALAPAGFRKMISQPNSVWRPATSSAIFVDLYEPGRAWVHGSTDGGATLRWRGSLSGVLEYLRSQGVFG